MPACSWPLTFLAPFRLSPLQSRSSSPRCSGGSAGLVDIGGGREMYLECCGTGSPTVVLISGKGNSAATGARSSNAGDPVPDADYNAVTWERPAQSESAVFPMVARVTRACGCDRRGVGLMDRTSQPRSPSLILPTGRPTTGPDGQLLTSLTKGSPIS